MNIGPDGSEFFDEHEELKARRHFMLSRGYRFCSIPACNCNSWHGGHSETRLREIREMLEEMGVPLNGIVLQDAIKELALTAGYYAND